MFFRVALAALFVVCTAWAAVSQDVSIGSTSIKVMQPQDQCAMSNDRGEEASLLGNLRKLLGGENQLLAAFADCGQLAEFRSGKRTSLDDFAHYMTPTEIVNAVLPADAPKQLCSVIRAKGDESLTAILQSRASEIERVFPSLKMNEAKSLGVLFEEPFACYTGQMTKLTSEDGTEKIQIAVIAMTLIKSKLVNYQIFSVYRSGDTVSDVLGKHKANVAALIAANVR